MVKRVLLKLVVVALGGVTLYALAGFFLAPRLVERRLEAMVEEQTGLTLAIEAAKVNPFTLTLSLGKVTLFRSENTAVAAIDGLEARMRPATIGIRTWQLRDIAIRALAVADLRRQAPLLTVPSVAIPALTIGTSPATLSFDVARLDRPRLRLRRGPQGAIELPPELTSLWSGTDTRGNIRLAVSGGSIEFSDQSAGTPLELAIGGIEGIVARRRSGPDTTAVVSLRGRVSAGTAEISAGWLPSRPRDAARVELEISDLELAEISPYVAGAVGRRVLAGHLDLNAQIVLDQGQLELDNRIVLRNLELGERAGNPAVRALPVELAAALLEDREGRIDLSVPVPRSADAGGSSVTAFSQGLADYIAAIAESPFERLAVLVGRPDLDLGSFAFAAGSADAVDDSREKLAALDRALNRRPKLGLTVYPGFDPATDRDALARRQIRLHVNLATSEVTPTQAAGKAIDLDDPQVRGVLDEFGENRLPQAEWTAIGERFTDRDTARYRAVLTALIDNEEVSRSALERLARYRARSIVNALLQFGHDPGRIRQADSVAVTAPDDDSGAVVRLAAEIVGREAAGGSGERKRHAPGYGDDLPVRN